MIDTFVQKNSKCNPYVAKTEDKSEEEAFEMVFLCVS